MRPFGIALFAVALLGSVGGAPPASRALPRLQVSENRHFLVTANGQPFFYLGDTAWELFHRLDRKQAVEYLDKRASQRYNVIQAVALAQEDGLGDPNPHGDLPFLDRDPTRPAVTPGADPANAQAYDYWDHVEFIIDQANRRGMYVGLLPTWARYATTVQGRTDRVLFAENAQAYGEFLGRRFGKKGVIWVLGGDRPATNNEAVWRAMAKGIAIGVSGRDDQSAVLMTYHPGGGHTSAAWFHEDDWLDFNMQQTGHSPIDRAKCWSRIREDYDRAPTKPVMDGEPLYEDHPIGFRQAKEYGYSLDAHVRQRAYWDVFSGAFGHTYGNHSVWQMVTPARRPVNGPILYWREALLRPGADQMRHLRALIESRPYLSRVPDQSLVVDPLSGPDHISATRGDGYAFIYSAQGRPFTVNLGRLSGDTLRAWWYNPRSGDALLIDTFPNRGSRDFTCPSHGGFGTDMVLVLDDNARNFGPPGGAPHKETTR